MKKNNLHLFIMSISVLVFVLISSFNCFAQNEEKFNWGELWLDMDSAQKTIFFVGIREGMSYFILDILSDTSASGLSDLSNAKKELFTVYTWKKYDEFHENREVLKDIITNLYKYPENSYIRFPYMIDIAIKKLKGDSIEKLLEKRRKEAYENN